MSFLNQFASHFTYQEKQTELYNLWSAIGANLEKTILEEQNKLNAELSDINNFSEDTMRSWLSFFLQKIPYRTTATTQVTVKLANDTSKITEINKYDQLTTDDGIIYTLLDSISLIPGDVRTVTAAQGKRITETGTYSSLIKVQANNPDLNYIEVKINGQTIPEVTYETSYDQLMYSGPWKPQSNEEHEWGGTPYLQDSYGKKGTFYSVIADGETRFSDDGIPIEFKTGDLIVYDGSSWQRSAYTNKLQPIQFAASYAIPKNGYFAYYHNNYLYIKIFSGSEISDPNGQNYEVSYIQSDGIQGQINANTLSFVQSYEDINETPVILEVSNTVSSPAANQPSTGKLGLYLKQRLYSSINVSSIPEYINWFNAQPEVGDCLVLSDYERYIRNGKRSLDITGVVNVYLVGIDGNPLSDEVKNELLERIEPYKDIAVLQISEFTEVYQYLEFNYTSATNESAFEQFLQSVGSQYYDINYLQSKNSSLFDDLDLASIVDEVQTTSPYNSTGLILKGYHYLKLDLTTGMNKITFDSYNNENPGTGWYILTTSSGEVYEFKESINVGSETSGEIWDLDNLSEPIGNHIDTSVSMDFSRYNFSSATLECYWGMKNEGILSIGAENGIRKLHKIEVKRI